LSQHHTRNPLNASRVRARKRALAARDGAWCTYCGRLFADLRQATIDHVVPLSLFRTWRIEHTVLACQPCNHNKADRLPLLLALLLTTVHGAPEVGRVFTVDCWALLARLAAAYESGFWSTESADSAPDRAPAQSKADQHRHSPARTRLTVLVNTPDRSGTCVTADVTPASHLRREAA
jgi:hypothetical protein